MIGLVSSHWCLMNKLLNDPQAIGATFAAMIGAGMLVRSISYEHSPMPKHLAWALHAGTDEARAASADLQRALRSDHGSLCAGVMGAVIAPLTLLGGPLMVRAAWYTAGIVGGLSTVAMCAPSEKFLSLGGPLAVGFGVVFASSLGESFSQFRVRVKSIQPPNTASYFTF